VVLKVLDSADGDGENLLEGDGVAGVSERVSGGVVTIMVGDGPLSLRGCDVDLFTLLSDGVTVLVPEEGEGTFVGVLGVAGVAIVSLLEEDLGESEGLSVSEKQSSRRKSANHSSF